MDGCVVGFRYVFDAGGSVEILSWGGGGCKKMKEREREREEGHSLSLGHSFGPCLNIITIWQEPIQEYRGSTLHVSFFAQ